MTAVVVAGALANKAGSGGEAWVRMSWVRGLQRLGLDVTFVEELPSAMCVDGNGAPAAPNQSVNAAYFRNVVDRFGLADRATLLVDGDVLIGSRLDRLRARAATATLVNISGHLENPRLLGQFRRRVLVDIDPGFTQFWHALGNPGARVDGHDVHFTIAENIGTPDCSIPTGGIEWRTVRQPIVLDDWPFASRDHDGPIVFTTVANWRGPFGPVEFDGHTFGLKVHEFRKLMELPSQSGYAFEIALNIHPEERRDLNALNRHGWRIVDPGVAADPESFRDYVRSSDAEFSVAQGIYVDTNSGWFSDRTVRYLASGRPALVQDTGFGRTLPVGKGLVPFQTVDDAVAGAEHVATHYETHATAARAIAERHFDSDLVLSRFCDEAGIGAS